jgi:integrase
LLSSPADPVDNRRLPPAKNINAVRLHSRCRSGYLTLGEFRWAFNPAAKTIGADGLKPHELRHTCASLAIAAGANVKVLQTLLGHKTATLTLDRYGHLFPDDLGQLADAFDAAAKSAADGLRTITPLLAVPSE